MKIPFNALVRALADHESELVAALADVVRSGMYILGPHSQAFERELGARLGRSVIGCNSGTDALVLGLKVLNVRPGDEVITVAHTAIPTVTAICTIGARPKFADIDPDTWLMDSHHAATLVTPRTKAIIPVHLYGNAMSLDALPQDIPVLEDVAQAFGATVDGRPAGGLASVAALSFYPTKNLGAIGDAGAIVVASDDNAERARMLRNYGQRDRYNAAIAGGLNSRLDELQAAVLSVRLKRVDMWNAERTGLVERYRSELQGLPLRFQAVSNGVVPAWHLAVIALESAAVRDGLRRHLEERGIQTLIHYPIPAHRQVAFSTWSNGVELPHTESLVARIVSLPLYVGLTEAEQTAVIDAIHTFFG